MSLHRTILVSALLLSSSLARGHSDPSLWSDTQLAARLLGIAFPGTEVTPEVGRWVGERGVGAIVLYRTTTEDPAAVRGLTAAIRKAVPEGSLAPLIAIDQEGGSVIRYGPAMLPSAMAIAATGSRAVSREAGVYVGSTLRQAGIVMNLAPVLDLATAQDASELGTRAFSSSPDLVAEMAVAYIDGLREAGTLATVKHFPGQGSASADPHSGASVVSRTSEQIARDELTPFRAAIEAGVDAVMTAHVRYPNWPSAGDDPATFSNALISDLLRKQLRFSGLVITDAINMPGTGEQDPGKAAVRAVLAGADLVLTHGARHADLAWLGLTKALGDGTLPRARAEASARRVLAAQAKAARPARLCAIDPAFHERLARLAVTDVRIDADAPAIADSIFVGSTGPIADAFESASRIDVPIRPGELQVQAIAGAIAQRGKPVVALIQNRLQSSVFERAQQLAPEMKITLVVLGSPADAASIRASRYVLAYSFLPESQRAALDVLLGKRCAPGRLPMALPGIAQVGAGDLRCKPDSN